jgi:hypothetical protein
MRKAGKGAGLRRTGGENLNPLREAAMAIRDEDNMLARVLKVKLEKDGGGRFKSLQVFPPKWWR